MKYVTIIFLLFSIIVTAQDTEPINAETSFKDGIYFTFEDFKNNKPNVEQFNIVEQKNDLISLQFACTAKDGSDDICYTNNAWGFCKDNSIYIFQGVAGRYFRMTVIGYLSHYIEYHESYYYDSPYSNYNYGYNSIPHRTIQAGEMVLNWETGKSFALSYQSLSEFIKIKDPELYSQWMNTKKKKKMTYFFLLKYNERNKAYFNSKK